MAMDQTRPGRERRKRATAGQRLSRVVRWALAGITFFGLLLAVLLVLFIAIIGPDDLDRRNEYSVSDW
jgi:hypothetical protein